MKSKLGVALWGAALSGVLRGAGGMFQYIDWAMCLYFVLFWGLAFGGWALLISASRKGREDE